MPFVAGDLVLLVPSKVLGSLAPMLGGGGVPLIGTVEAVATPSVKVTWQNGLSTQYLDDGAQLIPVAVPSILLGPLLHSRVTLSGAWNAPGNPNGQGVSEGLVIGIFAATIAGVDSDFLVIKFSAGDIAIFTRLAVV
jgi:hypothetical protein